MKALKNSALTAQEMRNEIIRENLPKLIKKLTDFEADDENLIRCEQFAWSIIRNHKNLSTNSHDVKRKIEAIREKFRVDNYPEYADHLSVLCNEITSHPLCLEHYELDVHWSLLDFLLSLAYNPTGALKRNKYNIDLERKQVVEEVEDDDLTYWQEELKKCHLPLERNDTSDSDLSIWSDDISNHSENIEREQDHLETGTTQSDSNISKYHNLSPPRREKYFVEFDGTKSEKRLLASVQNTWWLPHVNLKKNSTTRDCFAISYSRFISETSNNMIPFRELTIVSEWCLMRELLWMFHSPISCKFFILNKRNGIQVRPYVSVPSLCEIGLKSFLDVNFLPFIRMMHMLKLFLRSVYENCRYPKTIESYAANVRTLLQPICEDILVYEARLITQKDFEINSILDMHLALKNSFSTLQSIYDIHCSVMLYLEDCPGHITSSYVLISLMNASTRTSSSIKANMAAALFLTTIKIFCTIIDTWWTEGRLDDWYKEFLVERSLPCLEQAIKPRPFTKANDGAILAPEHISTAIMRSALFCFLLEHALEAGCNLNLLYEINRVGDLRNACAAIEEDLYDVFIDDVLANVKRLQPEVTQLNASNDDDNDESKKVDGDADADAILNDDANADADYEKHSVQRRPSISNNLITCDEFLLAAFFVESGSVEENSACNTKEKHPKAYNILNQLNEGGNVILPFEKIVLTSLERILKSRIAFANSFVMKLYREEFGIKKHLRNIRKVLLLEESDLMYQFYENLFRKIESGQNWANAFLLTTQLDDIFCSKYAEMSSLFRIEIQNPLKCQTYKVYEAVDELHIMYNVDRELSYIITEHDLAQYNKIFRLLLKVKWALSTLEKLRFPNAHKHRIPYIKYDMVDLLMRRLEQLRFWVMFSVQNIHFHLMTYVLQSMGEQLERKIDACTNLKELEMVHKSYIRTVCEHCLLSDDYVDVKLGVEQLLNLVFIVRLEWNSCTKYLDNSQPLSQDLSVDNSDGSDIVDYPGYAQVDALESAYIQCQQFLAHKLNKKVYLKQKAFLSGLSAAFNACLPY